VVIVGDGEAQTPPRDPQLAHTRVCASLIASAVVSSPPGCYWGRVADARVLKRCIWKEIHSGFEWNGSTRKLPGLGLHECWYCMT
jgi:hypothetical protein